ncbi:MAG: 4'-phosphopantetheinyl transferase superfamily protein [Polaromonas sp.]
MLHSQKLMLVHAWPQGMQAAVDELRSFQALTVISVATPATAKRLLARDLVRTALRETLAVFLDQPAASVKLVSYPGQAIRVDFPLAHLNVSVSHAPGLSLAAIGRGAGAGIGVDVMPVDRVDEEMPDWADVALDYLGPTVTGLLQRTSPAQRPVAFAQAWTRFEAGLKCLGLALTEWTPVLAQQLAACRVMALALPENCCGAIALNTDTERFSRPFIDGQSLNDSRFTAKTPRH